MARPGLTQHRKFLRLARLLGNAPLALGCLELMWEKCYLNGEAYLGDALDVEAAAQWPGVAGTLSQALRDAGGEGNPGFIEEVPGRPGHFQCHDLFDHAPRYVASRLKRELERQEKGQTLSQLRSEAGKKGAERSKQAAREQQVSSKQTLICREKSASEQQVSATPAPAPAPAPVTSLRSVCTELPLAPPVLDLAVPPQPEPSVIDLPCVGNGSRSYRVTQAQVDGWATAYPGLEVLQELRKAKVWLEANPRKGKTSVGMGRFLVSWLSRAQDTPRISMGARASPPPTRRCAAAEEDHRSQVSQLHFQTLPLAEPQP